MSDVAVRIEHLGKRYRLGRRRQGYITLREKLVFAVQAPLRAFSNGKAESDETRDFWAVRDVSLEVNAGEVLGIIGRNGAGKSTLLKLLSRVTRPTTGEAEIHGRVGSLLEVGTGFHPELTGRENIYLNGAILGMTRTEIQRNFDAIVDFAGIEPFLDTPVKRYSSGMHMRLAFSIAAHLEPEILLVDEVLAVGDTAFQKRCLGKMRGIAKNSGRTVLFVSHNLQAVQTLCDRAVFLSGGRAVFDGPVSTAIGCYLDSIQEVSTQPLDSNPDRGGNGAIRIVHIATCDEHGQSRKDFVAGEGLAFDFEYVRLDACTGVALGFTIYNQLGVACTHANTSTVDFRLAGLADTGHILCRINRNPFPVGDYYISVVVTTDDGVADYLPDCLSFRVISSRFFATTRIAEPDLLYCPVMVDHEWDHAVT